MHSDAAWAWFSRRNDDGFFFCRFTQLGLLRLLATSAIMGNDVRTIGGAWTVYDRWLEDSRIGIRQESFELDAALRAATRSVFRLSSPKALGDCYLLAVSQISEATLVTFDRGLASACRKARQPVTLLETHPTEKD
jgi:predicted nucleic acid-binding protein